MADVRLLSADLAVGVHRGVDPSRMAVHRVSEGGCLAGRRVWVDGLKADHLVLAGVRMEVRLVSVVGRLVDRRDAEGGNLVHRRGVADGRE